MIKIDGKDLGQIMWLSREVARYPECQHNIDGELDTDLYEDIYNDICRNLVFELEVRTFNMINIPLRNIVMGWVL